MAKNNNSSNSLSYYAWQRIKKNKLAMFGLIIIVLCMIVALLGYAITPDSSPDANTQLLEIAKKRPGFNVKMLQVRKNGFSHKTNFFNKMLFGEISDYTPIPILDYRFEADKIIVKAYTEKNKSAAEEMDFNIADIVYAVNYNMPIVINAQNSSIEFNEFGTNKQITKAIQEVRKEIVDHNIITKTFILGTDPVGRDLLSRLIIGTRISFSVGFISVFISLLIGMSLGAIAGFFRGKVDHFIVWVINVIWAIPTLLLVIAITLVLGKGFWQVFVAVGLTMWVEVARVVRGQVLSLREKEFIEAGRALGFKNMRIIFRHVLPNVMGSVIIISAANFASAILTEAGLSFLGIGAQPPTASWGAMISAHRGYIISDMPYLAFLPGVAIMIMVLAFVLLGNGLRDALDTKSVDEDQIMI
ncbi:MAG: ABC transporter permease [Bacteroidia bacterium]